MRNINYLLVMGVIGVAAATSLSFVFQDHWVGYSSALLVSILFLLMLNRWMSINIESIGIKKTVRYIVALVVILQIYFLALNMLESDRRHWSFVESRKTYDSNIGQLESEQVLIKSLRHYYQMADPESRTIESSFRKIAGDRLNEDNELTPRESVNSRDLNYMVEFAAADSVIVKVHSKAAKGMDEAFENFNGGTGKYQAVASLTPNGVRYVREN